MRTGVSGVSLGQAVLRFGSLLTREHDVILTKNHPRIINEKSGECMPQSKNRGMFISENADVDSDEPIDN